MRNKSVTKAYYSHSMHKYNTKEEKAERDYIERVFSGIVICPNRQIGASRPKRVYMHLITHMDAVFVSEYGQGIGKGVYDECDHALKKSIPVYVVIKGTKGYYHLPVKGVERIPNHRQWDSFGKLIIDHAPFLNYLDRFQELMMTGR